MAQNLCVEIFSFLGNMVANANAAFSGDTVSASNPSALTYNQNPNTTYESGDSASTLFQTIAFALLGMMLLGLFL